MRNEELGPDGIPFVRGGDIGNGPINHRTTDCIRSEFRSRVMSKLTRPWDVAFITKGTVGRVGILRPEQPPVVFAPQVAYWRTLDERHISPRFLYYLLSGADFQASLDADKTHGAMVADYVSLSQQLNFRITLPPIAFQRAIARILGALDDKIELNRRMNETLEAMARALFQSWFVDFDPVRAKAAGRQPAGIDAETARIFPSDFVESEIGRIPRGWRVTNLAELTSKIGSGATPRGGDKAYVDEGVALIRSQNVYDSQFVWQGLVRITDEDAARLVGVTVAPMDVLLNITGASFLRTCVVDQEVLPARVNQHVAIVRPKADISSRYVHQHLLLTSTRSYLMGLDAGASRQAITKGHIESVPIIWPTIDALKRWQLFTTPMFSRSDMLQAESRRWGSLRDTLLPKLLSGELRVPEAEAAVGKAV